MIKIYDDYIISNNINELLNNMCIEMHKNMYENNDIIDFNICLLNMVKNIHHTLIKHTSNNYLLIQYDECIDLIDIENKMCKSFSFMDDDTLYYWECDKFNFNTLDELTIMYKWQHIYNNIINDWINENENI